MFKEIEDCLIDLRKSSMWYLVWRVDFLKGFPNWSMYSCLNFWWSLFHNFFLFIFTKFTKLENFFVKSIYRKYRFENHKVEFTEYLQKIMRVKYFTMLMAFNVSNSIFIKTYHQKIKKKSFSRKISRIINEWKKQFTKFIIYMNAYQRGARTVILGPFPNNITNWKKMI